MKNLLFAAYIFFCTGGAYAQERQNVIVAELNFSRPPLTLISKDSIRRHHLSDCLCPYIVTVPDTTAKTKGYMVVRRYSDFYCQPDGSYRYAISRKPDTLYLDDRKRPVKMPVPVWSMKRKEEQP